MHTQNSISNRLFTTSEWVAQGKSRQALIDAVKRNDVERICRGVYLPRNAIVTESMTLQIYALKYPQGVFCLATALRYHNFTTQIPHDIWLAIKNHVRIRGNASCELRLTMMSDASFDYGIEEHIEQGIKMQVYSPAKTVADCFKFRNKIGLDVAIEALHEGYRKKMFTVSELMKAAKVCRVVKVIEPYVEGILA